MTDDFPLFPGHTYPDLTVIPRERWMEALRPYPRLLRQLAMKRVYPKDGDWDAIVDHAEVLNELDFEESERRMRGAVLGRDPAVPGVDVRGRRQVNVKLTAEEHERLSEAAEGLGLRPTQLARMYVVRGTRATLRPSS